MENFDISSTLKKNPKFKKKLWKDLKEKILGKEYELSLVFVGEKKSKNLNKKFRKKDYSADILSFPIEKNFGEIFICPKNCQKKAKDFERSEENFLDFIFIHGLAHLKGYDHMEKKDEEKMEKFEQKVRKDFGV